VSGRHPFNRLGSVGLGVSSSSTRVTVVSWKRIEEASTWRSRGEVEPVYLGRRTKGGPVVKLVQCPIAHPWYFWGVRGSNPVGGLAGTKGSRYGDSSVQVSRNIKVVSGKIFQKLDGINFSSKSV
jgi:hypothetical protein